MTPNNSTIKLMSNEDQSEDMTSDLKKLILEEKKCISYTYVSLRFGVHVKQAIEVLDKFVAEERNNGNTLSLNYMLSGNNDSSDNDNEIKMERFMIVNESDIDSANDWFKNGFKKHIYSVGFGEDNDKIELNFDEYDYEVKDKKDLNDLQNLRYVKNPNIELRDVRRRVAIKPIVHQIEDKIEETKSKSNDNKVSETKSKAKTNSKSKNTKKKNKVSNMFSKNKKEVKVENEDKESDDPFGSDSEEEVKPNVEDSQPLAINEKNVSDDEIKEEKEEEIPKTTKNGSKRQSKNFDSSEDEDIISTKKKSKKYKRIRMISESDSDDNEEEEETVLDKFVSTKKDNSKPLKKVEKVKETHVDEDGYVVTKTVEKEVEVDTKESKKVDTKESKKDKSEDNSEKPEKTKPNAKKTNEKKVEKKTKDTKSKGQSSITSFFKPKQIST